MKNRLLWRMAWRDLGQHPGRWWLSTLLIAVTVAVGVYVSATDATLDNEYLEYQNLQASWVVRGVGFEGPLLPMDEFDEVVEVLGDPQLVRYEGASPIGEPAQQLQVEITDLDHPWMEEFLIPRLNGRLPVGPSEALSTGGHVLGESVPLVEGRDVTVVGLVDMRFRPGLLIDESHMSVGDFSPHVITAFYGGASAGAQERLGEAGLAIETERGWWDGWNVQNPREFAQTQWSALAGAASATVGALSVLLIGAIFASAFRRRLREIGLVVASGGGDHRTARRVLVTTGAVTGIVGVFVGYGLGIGAYWMARSWYVGSWSEQYLEAPSSVPWMAVGVYLLAPGLVGLATALAACLYPAYRAAKMPVVVALMGSLPKRPAWRFSGAFGVSMLLVGFISVLLTFYYPGGEDFVSIGVGVLLVGLASLAVGSMTSLTKLQGRSSRMSMMWLTMAARDLSRHWLASTMAVAFVGGLLMLAMVFSAEFGVAFAMPIILLMPVAFVVLLVKESEANVRVFSAVGAPPLSRRTYAAALATVLTVAGLVGAIPAATLLVVASFGLFFQVNVFAMIGMVALILLFVPAASWLVTTSGSQSVAARR